MKTIAIFLVLLAASLTGCVGPEYRERVMADRAKLPTLYRATWTGSMFPTIRGGELIEVTWKPFNRLKVGDKGDKVIFWPAWAPRPISHRAIRWAGPGRLVTRGDNCEHEDTWIVTEDIYIGAWEVIPNTAQPRPANEERAFQGLRYAPQ